MEETKRSTDWVTVACVNQRQEAYMMKSLLEAEGMLVFLKDELTVGTYMNAIGGVKVQVPEPEARVAYELLVDGGYLPRESPLHTNTSMSRFSRQYAKQCPFCNSENILNTRKPGAMMLFGFLLSLPLPLFRQEYRCYKCGQTWRVK